MRYLIVVAHPDDEILGAGATISKLIKNNNEVDVCIMCAKVEARKSNIIGKDIIEIIEKVATFMEIRNKYLYEYPNIKMNTIPHLNLVQSIENSILESNPDIVITHSNKDINNDHKMVSEACDEAVRIYQRNNSTNKIKEYRYMEVLSSTEWSTSACFMPNTYERVGIHGLNKKIEALKLYDSAIKEFPHPRSEENIRALATYRGCQSGLDYAESFETVFRIENE